MEGRAGCGGQRPAPGCEWQRQGELRMAVQHMCLPERWQAGQGRPRTAGRSLPHTRLMIKAC